MGVFVFWFFCIGVVFGNINAMAMEPLGHIAGVAAAFVGTLTTFGSMSTGNSYRRMCIFPTVSSRWSSIGPVMDTYAFSRLTAIRLH